MLIEFTVGNFLSFKEKRTFSMEATSLKENESNVFEAGGYRLLKGGVIYGANASGKSNLIKALRAFEKLIKGSRKLSSTDEIDIIPFRLSTETENAPSFFEMILLAEGKYYRYGFEVTRKAVVREWLFHKPKGEKMLFIRDGQDIEIDKSLSDFSIFIDKTNTNSFFLSVLDSFNEKSAKQITRYLGIFFESAIGVHEFYRVLSVRAVINEEYKSVVSTFFRTLNLGFEKFRVNPDVNLNNQIETLVNQGSAGIKLDNSHVVPILTTHKVFNSSGISVRETEFDLDLSESTGTRKVLDILGPMALVLNNGGFFAMDEMDANLHPLLTQKIIELFHSPVTNPKNAQLVLTTHDTNLLSFGNYRRDQIWFTEKDNMGSTDLYSLAEFKLPDGKKVRNDASYESQYLEGRYGAIPFIGNIERLVSNGGQD